jgi:hypothetical protein
MAIFTITLSRPSLEYADVFVEADDAQAAEEIAVTRVDRSNIDWRDSDWLDGPSVEQSRATEYDRAPDPLLDPEESSYSDGNPLPTEIAIATNLAARMREIDSRLTKSLYTDAPENQDQSPTGDDYNLLWDAVLDEFKALGVLITPQMLGHRL